MDCRQKWGSIFGISCGNSPPTLQFQKSIFNEVTKTIDILVITSHIFTAFPLWNDWMNAIFLE